MYFMILWHHYNSCLSDGNWTGNTVTHLSKMTDLYTTAFPTSQITFKIQMGFTSPIWPWNEIKIFLMLQYILLLCCYLNATYTSSCYENLISSIDSQLILTNNFFSKRKGGKYWQKMFAIWILTDMQIIYSLFSSIQSCSIHYEHSDFSLPYNNLSLSN